MEGNQNPQMESLGGCKPGSAWEIIWLYILHEGNRPLTIHFYSVWKRLKSSHWNLLTLSSGINVTKLLSQRVCFDVWWSLSRICIYIYVCDIWYVCIYVCLYLYIYMYIYRHISIEYDIHLRHHPTTFTNFTTSWGMTIRHHIDHHQGRLAKQSASGFFRS